MCDSIEELFAFFLILYIITLMKPLRKIHTIRVNFIWMTMNDGLTNVPNASAMLWDINYAEEGMHRLLGLIIDRPELHIRTGPASVQHNRAGDCCCWCCRLLPKRKIKYNEWKLVWEVGVRVFITHKVLEICCYSLTCLDWQGIGKFIFCLKN